MFVTSGNGSTAPFLRLLLPFCIGILIAIFFNSFFPSPVAIIAILFSLVLFASITHLLIRAFSLVWMQGIIINICLCLVGYGLTLLKTDHLYTTHYSVCLDKAEYYHVRINKPVVEKENSIKTEVTFLTAFTGGENKPVTGKALVYFKKNKRSEQLNWGDELVIKNKLQVIDKPLNPGAFDYRTFMRYKNISYQSIQASKEWVYTGKHTLNPIKKIAFRLRNHLLEILKTSLHGDEFAVTAALLVGYTDDLEKELVSAFSKTGTLHVLSVSGLHVAVLFILFSRLLFFLDSKKATRLLKTILLILFLWFYALLSGLSPSVLRSATMFTFIVIAHYGKRNSPVYNTLAASAFLLLAIEPYLIMDVGFQLSYLAVAGIVYVQPVLDNKNKSEKWIVKRIKECIYVSIAAQVITFPLSCYYFQQFPNYFLLCNLLIIPVSTVVMYGGIILFFISWNAFLFNYFSMLFNWIVVVLNKAVVALSQLPAAITFIVIDKIQLILLYILLLFLILFFRNRRWAYLSLALICLCSFLFFRLSMNIGQWKQNKLIVYGLRGHTMIDFIQGKEHVVLADSVLRVQASFEKQFQFYWNRIGVKQAQIVEKEAATQFVMIKKGIMQFGNKKIILLSDFHLKNGWFNDRTKYNPDFLILTNNIKADIEYLKKHIAPKLIVMDASNSSFMLKKWKQACEQLNQPYYSIPDTGAFIFEQI